jgi:hypothetical protein
VNAVIINQAVKSLYDIVSCLCRFQQKHREGHVTYTLSPKNSDLCHITRIPFSLRMNYSMDDCMFLKFTHSKMFNNFVSQIKLSPR